MSDATGRAFRFVTDHGHPIDVALGEFEITLRFADKDFEALWIGCPEDDDWVDHLVSLGANEFITDSARARVAKQGADDATMRFSEQDLHLILGALRCRVDRLSIEAPEGMADVIASSNQLRARVQDEMERRGHSVTRIGAAEQRMGQTDAGR